MLNHAPFLYTTELESLATLCFRAFDGSNYEVRCCVAKLLGALIATTQQAPQIAKHNTQGNRIDLGTPGNPMFYEHYQQNHNQKVIISKTFLFGTFEGHVSSSKSGSAKESSAKGMSLEEALGVLMSGFLRGGIGFLKGTGEMIKGSSGVNREIRVGVTHVSIFNSATSLCRVSLPN